jgi:NtrC-family two-component system sensor histidine kinase KinB
MNWTLRKKILFGYSSSLVLVIIVLIWAIVNLVNLGKASDSILRENYNSIIAAEDMISLIERQDSAILLFFMGYENEGLQQFHENVNGFLQWLGRAKDNITVVGEDKIVQNIDQGYTSYLLNFSTLRLIYQTDTQKAARFYHETVLPSFLNVRNECVHLREINQKTMFNASDRARHVASRAILSMTVIGIAALTIGLSFSLLLSKLIVKPLHQIKYAAHKIADGNYDVEITVGSSDELGLLANEFNLMTKKLKSFHDLNIEQIMMEKQKSEAIIRNISDGIVVVDTQFKITGINPAAYKAFNIAPDVVVKDQHFLEIINNEPLFNYLKQAVDSKKPPKIEDDQNIITVQRGDSQAHYQFSITPMHSKSGSLVGVLLLLLDITKLKELDRMKSEFVMAASHELRTPLTSMEMSIDLLQENLSPKLGEKENQLLSVLGEEIHRLIALVNDLLDLSRIEAGKMEMDFEHVSIPSIFEQVMAIFKTQTEEKLVDLSFKIANELPLIKADFNKVSWILSNLIGNALRYIKPGGHIRLSAEQIGPQVHISVSDDGIGIPYEYQSKIFEKFIQVKDDKMSGASGLGLAISKEIVRAHGGTIWVNSTPGEGSKFTFTMPVAD